VPAQPPSRGQRHAENGLSGTDADAQPGANISTPLGQDELAETFGRTRRHLERIFKSVLQETPKGYYLGLRLEEARNLLADTTLSILEVAIATGFNSRSSFSKAYKKRFGMSPARYR